MGGHEPAMARVTACPQCGQDRLRRLCRPLADRQDRAGTGQHRGGGDREQPGHAMATPRRARGSGTSANNSSSRPQSAASTRRSVSVTAVEPNTAYVAG